MCTVHILNLLCVWTLYIQKTAMILSLTVYSQLVVCNSISVEITSHCLQHLSEIPSGAGICVKNWIMLYTNFKKIEPSKIHITVCIQAEEAAIWGFVAMPLKWISAFFKVNVTGRGWKLVVLNRRYKFLKKQFGENSVWTMQGHGTLQMNMKGLSDPVLRVCNKYLLFICWKTCLFTFFSPT